MLHSTPFLLFDGNCAEAMTFYKDCFGGELMLTRLGDTPMKEQFPAEKHDRIIYAQLKNNAIEFSATDWMASPKLEPKQGNTFSIYVTGETYEELKTVFDKLAVGADRHTRTFKELDNAPFGIYGQFTDKYGVSWIFRGTRQQEK
jgi:PhnB protein